MSVKQGLDRVPSRRRVPHTYFVGRRMFEAAEIYSVTTKAVERLRSARRSGERSLDWHGSDGARIELSRQLIRRVTGRRPSRELQARFALYVLARLPDGGFVLDSDEIWRWLALSTDEDDFAQAGRPRESWPGRLRARFRRPAGAGTDG